MSNSAESSLLRVASSTFEDLGFLIPERKLSEIPRAAALEEAVSVGFDGTLRGSVQVRLYGGVLPVLAMNMLGDDEPPSLALQRDAPGEVASVICGNLLPMLAGAREVFRLTARSATDARPGPGPTASAVIGLEQRRAEVLLFTEAGQVAA